MLLTFSSLLKDGVIENTLELMWDNLNIHAHTIAFPEIILPTQIQVILLLFRQNSALVLPLFILFQLKKFTKTCKVPNYSKQVRSILTKMEENSKTITQRRRTANLSLADTSAVVSYTPIHYNLALDLILYNRMLGKPKAKSRVHPWASSMLLGVQ